THCTYRLPNQPRQTTIPAATNRLTASGRSCSQTRIPMMIAASSAAVDFAMYHQCGRRSRMISSLSFSSFVGNGTRASYLRHSWTSRLVWTTSDSASGPSEGGHRRTRAERFPFRRQSAVAEFSEAVVVDAEVMADFVDDRDPDHVDDVGFARAPHQDR